MAVYQYGQYLLVYDISDPKRLQRVHRVLKKSGYPVQYSVFSLILNEPALVRLIERLECLIDIKKDDIRCYRLPAKICYSSLGQQFFPDDVMLFSQGVNRLCL